MLADTKYKYSDTSARMALASDMRHVRVKAGGGS